jgi:hypothetical protein
MTCSCKKKSADVRRLAESTYSTDEWGPSFWKLLHLISMRIGSTTNAVLLADEIRLFEQLLIVLQKTLPCKDCQEHYTAYYNQVKPPALNNLSAENVRTTVKQWLLTLHNAVNVRLEKPVTITTIEEYDNYYKDVTMQPCDNNMITDSLKAALLVRYIMPDGYRKFISIVTQLRLKLGI